MFAKCFLDSESCQYPARGSAAIATNHVILTRVVYPSAGVGRTPDERMDCRSGEGKDLVVYARKNKEILPPRHPTIPTGTKQPGDSGRLAGSHGSG